MTAVAAVSDATTLDQLPVPDPATVRRLLFMLVPNASDQGAAT